MQLVFFHTAQHYVTHYNEQYSKSFSFLYCSWIQKRKEHWCIAGEYLLKHPSVFVSETQQSSPAALLGTVRGLEGASAGMQPNCRSILLQTLRLQCMHSNMSSFPLPPLTPKLKTALTLLLSCIT